MYDVQNTVSVFRLFRYVLENEIVKVNKNLVQYFCLAIIEYVCYGNL